jgi:hypothetical protein
MRASPLAVAVGLLAGLPASAGAQGLTADYGGGAVGGDPGRGFRGLGTVWMSAAAGGGEPAATARVIGEASLECGLARFDARASLAPDGSFTFTRARRWRDAGARLRAVVTVSGRFEGETATGTIRARLRTRHDGRTTRCSTGPARPWRMRVPIAGAPAGAPAAGATYHGLTTQIEDVPPPFLLRTSADGARVATAIFVYRRVCRRATFLLNNLTPGAPIAADGTFTLRDRFRLRFTDVVERFRVVVRGGFTAGRVQGTLRVTSVARSRRTGRVVDRCDTRDVGFGAHL